MLAYFVIAFVLLLALAPLLHFRPNKRQRALAAMREYAAVNGLLVQYRKFPASERSIRPPEGDIIFYGLRLSPEDRRATLKAVWVMESGAWRSLGSRIPAPSALQTLPEGSVAAVVDEAGCGVFWIENGGMEQVERICESLRAWAKDL
tara:strand:+ start:10284 stop:10727 length:444 start_codon:yes stop_codon:yes gene_type:complete